MKQSRKGIVLLLLVVFITEIFISSITVFGTGMPVNSQISSVSDSNGIKARDCYTLSANENYKLSGYISTETASKDPYSKANFEVVIYQATLDADSNIVSKQMKASAYTDVSGFFEVRFEPTVSDYYTVEVFKKNYLRRVLTGRAENDVNIAPGISDISFGSIDKPVVIWAGDFKQDDAINMYDIVECAKHFNTYMDGNKYDANYDLNLDNAINMADIVILARHFSKASVSYAQVTPDLSASEFLSEDGNNVVFTAKVIEAGKDYRSKMDKEDDSMDIFRFKPPEDGIYRLDFYSSHQDVFGAFLGVYNNKYEDFQRTYDFKSGTFYTQASLEGGKEYVLLILKYTGKTFVSNTYRVKVSRLHPDLEISGITPDYATLDKPAVFKAVVRNCGQEATKAGDSFRVALNIDGQSTFYTAAYSLPIPPDGSVDGSGKASNEAVLGFTLPDGGISYSQQGMHTLTASIVDSNIVENSILNNKYKKYFYVEDYGNTNEDAQDIETGKDICGRIDYGYYSKDSDFFRFSVPVDGTYIIQTTGNTDTHGVLYDRNGSIAYGYDSGEGNKNFLIRKGLKANVTYYIAVYFEEYCGATPYTLRIDHIKPDLIIEDITPYYPIKGEQTVFSARVKNNSEGTAPGGFRIGFKVDDSDTILWTDNYSLPLEPGKSDTLSAIGGVNGSTITFGEKGKHTVKAIVDDLGTVLEEDEGNNELVKTIVVDDYANEMGQAAPIAMGSEVSGSIQYSGECDWFSFKPDTDGMYRLSISGEEGVCKLYDQSGALVELPLGYEVQLDANKTYYIKIQGEYYSTITDYKIYIDLALPDLVITDITPTYVKQNTAVVLSAVVKNTGNKEVFPGQRFRVRFSIDGQDTPYYSDYHSSLIGPDAPLAEFLYKTTATVPMSNTGTQLSFDQKGIYRITAEVVDKDFDELKNDNNSLVKDINVGYADLVVAGMETTGECMVDRSVGFDITVKNLGAEATNAGVPFKVKLTTGKGNKTYYTDVYSSAIGQDKSVTFSVPGISFKDIGQDIISASIEYTGDINELNKNNNSYVKNIDVNGIPDLIVTDICYNPSDITEGEKVTFIARVKNIGSGEKAEDKALRVGFKIDDSDDAVIWSEACYSQLDANESVDITGEAGAANGVWEAAAGQHKITAVVDYKGEIFESDEENNTFSESITIGKMCDLKVEDISLDPANPIAGEKVVLKARIGNTGEGASPAGRIHRVGFKINDEPVSIWSESFNWSVESGGCVTVPATGGANGLEWIGAAGTYKITAVVDDTGTIGESDEINNSYTENVTVTQERVFNPLDDYDGDGLTNSEETSHKTDAYSYDTDGDGINDYDEIYATQGFQTDPSNPDTDGDGINDLTEVKLSKSPLTRDENFLVSREAYNNTQSVTVNVIGDANFKHSPIKVFESEDLSLESVDGIVGKPVEVSLGGYTMEQASITFDYNETELGNANEEDLTIYWVDYENSTLVPLPQDKVTIDTVNNKITGSVSQFSTYILGLKNVGSFFAKKDIVFAIDESGSMSDSDPKACRRSIASKFVSKMDIQRTRAAIVAFEGMPETVCGLTDKRVGLQNELNGMGDYGGGTDIQAALKQSEDILKNSGNTKYVILLSDGGDDRKESILEFSRRMAGKNISVITVALGNLADIDLLTGIAGITKGECFKIDTGLTGDALNKEMDRVCSKILYTVAAGRSPSDNASTNKKDTNLAYINVNGTYIPDFDQNVLNYTVSIPWNSGTLPGIPEIKAGTANPFATINITCPSEMPGCAEIEVTAQDGVSKKTYTISLALSSQGSIDEGGEVDSYGFTPGTSKKFNIRSTGNTDTYIEVYDESNKQIAYKDDSDRDTNFNTSIDLAGGHTYRLAVSHCDREYGTGAYGILISDAATSSLSGYNAYLEDLAAEAGGTFRRTGNDSARVIINGVIRDFDSSNSNVIDGKIVVSLQTFKEAFAGVLTASTYSLMPAKSVTASSVQNKPQGINMDEVCYKIYAAGTAVPGGPNGPGYLADDDARNGNDNVHRIQTVLMKLGCWRDPDNATKISTCTATGYYGRVTEASVRYFQTYFMSTIKSGIVADDTAVELTKYNLLYFKWPDSAVKPLGARVREYLAYWHNIGDINSHDPNEAADNYTVGYSGGFITINSKPLYNLSGLYYLSSEQKCYAKINYIDNAIEKYYQGISNDVPSNGGFQTFAATIDGKTYHYSRNTITPYSDLNYMFKDNPLYLSAVTKFYDYAKINNIIIDQETKDFLANEPMAIIQASGGSLGQGLGDWVCSLAKTLKFAYTQKDLVPPEEFKQGTNLIRDLIRVSLYGKQALGRTPDKDPDTPFTSEFYKALRIVASDEAYKNGNTIDEITRLEEYAYKDAHALENAHESIDALGNLFLHIGIEVTLSKMIVAEGIAISSRTAPSFSTRIKTMANAISKINDGADDFLNFVSGKVVKLRDGLGFRPALAKVDNAEDVLTIVNKSEISNMSKIESIAGAAGRYLNIDEIAPEIAGAVKNVKFRGTVLDMMDESGNVLKRVVVPEGYRSTQQLLYKALTGEVDVTRWGYTNANKMEEVVNNINRYLNRTDLSSAPSLINSKNAGKVIDFGDGIIVEFDPLGFPIFKGSQLKVDLSILDNAVVQQKGLSNMAGTEHMQAATRKLKSMMQNEADNAGQTLENCLRSKGYTENQIIDIIDEEDSISGYIWHHNQETGRMQLVKREVHEAARHNGGNSLWGKERVAGVDD